MTLRTTAESNIFIEDNMLFIEGQYSMSADIRNFESVTLADEIPNITRKVNGAGFRGVRKGIFSVTDLGNSNVYLHNSDSKCIIILRAEGRPILINLYEEKDTLELYYLIKSAFDELD